MTTLREAATQALQALEDFKRRGHWGDFDNLTGALKAALEADDGMYGAKALTVAYENGWNAAKAEPVQEPVAWFHTDFGSLELSRVQRVGWKPLYAAPPQRKPLTEEEIDSIWDSEKAFADIYAIARAIERAHGIGGSND